MTAPVFVGSNSMQLGAGVSSQTYTRTIAANGNAFIVKVGYGSASSNQPIATWPAGWIVHDLQVSTGGGRVAIGILPNATAGSNSVTVSFASGSYTVGAAEEWSGVDTSTSIVDLVLTATAKSTTLTPTGTPDTTSQADEALLAITGTDEFTANGTISDTAPTGYTTTWSETNANSYATGSSSYKILSAITTVSDTWTFNQSSYANEVLLISIKGASGGSTNTADGSATVTPTAHGSALASQSAKGAATVAVAAAGAALAILSAVGSATVQPTAQGSAAASQAAQGAAIVTPTAKGAVVSVGTNYAHGAASITPTAAGIAQAYASARGAASISTAVHGQALAFLPAQGSATVQFTAQGTAYASQSAIGSATIQPTASGTTHPPIQSYPVDPHYYAVMPARFFYAAAPFRAFYAKAPFRSFYALCQSDMAVPIPYAIDPSETKVLTLDATADLPSGVTLTGTPTVDVVVLSGSDGSAAAHFTGAVMNSTPITVDTATGGTVTIATGLAVQLIASGCVDGVQYEIRITCQTSQSNNVEVLKATLTCSAS